MRVDTSAPRSGPARDGEWAPAAVPDAAAALERGGLPPHLAQLLSRRGVSTPAAARRFLEPREEDLRPVAGLAGLSEAVERLRKAGVEGRRVVIVGDYDVDGVASTALLLASLRACGIAAESMLPHRLEEGYGLQPAHVERAVASGVSLILAVDTGTTAHAAVGAALASGLEVVVVDHHLPGGPLPAEVTLVNPKQQECTYPDADLCAAGLSLKLALALGERVGRPLPLAALLRIACLGTIADMVPLTGENRVIAALGLAALPDTRSAGLQALYREAGLRPPFAAADVSFRIGPRLNAAGRLGSAEPALELLLTRDRKRAGQLAAQLETLNAERQAQEQQVVVEAEEMVEARGALPPLIMAWKEGWHRGVVGIAASRLARRYHRPTLLLGMDGESATGSGRSVPGIHLFQFLQPWQDRMLRFGGHAQAVGLTVEAERLAGLRQGLEEAASAWPERLLRRRWEYELAPEPGALGFPLWQDLARLEPFGQGNPRPLLRVGPLRQVGDLRTFGRGHLRLTARGPRGSQVPLLGWRWADRAGELTSEPPFEVLGFLERDRISGRCELQILEARPVV